MRLVFILKPIIFPESRNKTLFYDAEYVFYDAEYVFYDAEYVFYDAIYIDYIEAVSKPIVFDAAFSLSSRDFFVSLRSNTNFYETCSLQRL